MEEGIFGTTKSGGIWRNKMLSHLHAAWWGWVDKPLCVAGSACSALGWLGGSGSGTPRLPSGPADGVFKGSDGLNSAPSECPQTVQCEMAVSACHIPR